MANPVIEPVARLIEAFSRLPGIGPKTAQRLTFHLLRAPDTEARILAAALIDVRDKVVFCDRCFNISDAPLCPICRDPGRDTSRLCVVEEPLDVLALERTAEFRGLYHVLHGAISPIDGVGPDRPARGAHDVERQDAALAARGLGIAFDSRKTIAANLAKGDYKFYCLPHLALGMRGKLTVQ